MKTWSGAFQIAAVYIGTIIGAGFATGREIVQFFSQFGYYGLPSILVSGSLFIFLGAKIMLKAVDIQASSYEELNVYLFGKSLAKAVNIIMFFMLVGVTGVMLSGTGALFEERLDMPANIGIILTVVTGFLIINKGIRGLLAVNVFVVPLMLLFHFWLFAAMSGNAGFWSSLLIGEDADNTWNTWSAPFSYAAFNLALAQAVLVPLAFEINDRRVIKRGALLGGVSLTVLMLVSHANLVQLTDVAAYEIPMAQVVQQFLPAAHFLYAFLILGEIFTSVIGNVYGMKHQLAKQVGWKPESILAAIFGAAFLLSQISYSTLLGYLYPLFGIISLVFLFLLWRK